MRNVIDRLRSAGLTLVWIGLALLPMASAGCSTKADAAPEEDKKLVEVTTTSPVRKDLTREVIQPGYLRPYEMTPIYAKIGGFADEPKFDIGDFVKEGQLLVKLLVPEVEKDLMVKSALLIQAKKNALAAIARRESARADVKAKEAAIRSADAEVMRWRGEWERAEQLLKKGIYDQGTRDQDYNQYVSSLAKRDEASANHHSAKANFDKAAADVDVADASVLVAQAAYDQWKDWLDYAQIPAPYNGIVTDRRVHKGHFVQPSNSGSTSKAAEPLFIMMRTDIMRCTVEVPELDALLIKDGDKAMVQLQAMPGSEMYGEVTRNTNALDDHTHTLRVEVHLSSPTGATVSYTASVSGAISSVQAKPPTGGTGYPPNATIPLLVVGGKGGIVNATTNSLGNVISYTLKSGGSNYAKGEKVAANTLAERMLRPNMYAKVTIFSKLPDAWTLPEDAVMNDILANGDRSYCFVVESDNKAHKLFLERGSDGKEGLQILRKQRLGSNIWEPITGMEVVITTNQKALQDGQEVAVKAAAAQ